MRYLALASDYDGTLARSGVVHPNTIASMEKLVNSGRKIILVTGRQLPDLSSVFSRLDLFERVVVENGAVLYNPATGQKQSLAARPPDEFIERLREKGITNFGIGDVIVDTWRVHAAQIQEIISEFDLDLHLIFNYEGVMVLPRGVDKMSGLGAALAEVGISCENVVAVGDAENDEAMFRGCGLAVAVANAIPQLKTVANLVTEGLDGEGTSDLIEKIIAGSLPMPPLA